MAIQLVMTDCGYRSIQYMDNNPTDRQLSIQFGTRRKLLANHLCVFKNKGPIAEDN